MIKIVTVVNTNFPTPILINAVGHTMLGIPAICKARDFAFRSFRDKNDLIVGTLTDFPFIVMKAKKQIHLKRCYEETQSCGIGHNAFLEAHRFSEPQEQQNSIAQSEIHPEQIIAITMFGPDKLIRPITRRFSLLNSS